MVCRSSSIVTSEFSVLSTRISKQSNSDGHLSQICENRRKDRSKRKKERNGALKLNKAFLSSTHSIQSRVDRKPQPNHLRGLDVNVGAAAALVALSRNDLVVVRTEVEAVARPGVEVVLHVDRAANTPVLADGPVLLESPGAVDRGLVGTGRDVDVVNAAVGGEAALELGAGARVVGAAVKGS
jgi:hypothetical protein